MGPHSSVEHGELCRPRTQRRGETRANIVEFRWDSIDDDESSTTMGPGSQRGRRPKSSRGTEGSRVGDVKWSLMATSYRLSTAVAARMHTHSRR